MVYIGKYDGYVHTLDSGRFIVGISYVVDRVVGTRNPPRIDPPHRIRKVVPLDAPMLADTFEQLAKLGAPTYANPNAAIKAARRVYPEIRDRYPWRECQSGVL